MSKIGAYNRGLVGDILEIRVNFEYKQLLQFWTYT